VEDTAGWIALSAAMVLAGALWWLYFDSAAELNLQVLELSGGSPTMARAIYAVGHMLPAFSLLAIAAGVGLMLEEDPPQFAFWLAGTGDPAGLGGPLGPDRAVAPDIPRTLSRIPDGAFTIVLAHNPALWPSLASRGVHLTLSGHTHYGQLSIPRIGWSLASLFLEHAMDWHARGQSLLYINPGTNYWGLPLRLGALPEVTVITLMRTASDAPEIRPAAA
jgi:hypothetical protein